MSSVLFDAPGPRAIRRHRMIAVATVLGLTAIVVVVIWKLAVEDQLTVEIWEPFVTPSIMQFLLEGVWNTLVAAGLAILLALPFGVLFGVGKLSDHWWLRWPSWGVVEFFRAVPLLMLILFIWYFFGAPLDVIYPLVIGLVLYNGSVLAEVFRAGIQAVPKGRAEAASALGMRKSQLMRIVQLPQAIKIMLPAIISQCVVALKDTSLGYYILAPVLTAQGQAVWREFDNQLAVGIVLAVIYIILNYGLTRVAEWAQRRMSATGEDVTIVAGQVQTRAGAGMGQA